MNPKFIIEMKNFKRSFYLMLTFRSHQRKMAHKKKLEKIMKFPFLNKAFLQIFPHC